MECVAGAHAYTVSSKVVGAQMELKVIGPEGATRLILRSPLTSAGKLASSEVLTATSLLVHAIEAPGVNSKPAAVKPTKKSAKLAKRPLHAPVRVAARLRARG